VFVAQVTDEEREHTKHIVYGLMYGMGELSNRRVWINIRRQHSCFKWPGQLHFHRASQTSGSFKAADSRSVSLAGIMIGVQAAADWERRWI
jgi:hypothetical protein